MKVLELRNAVTENRTKGAEWQDGDDQRKIENIQTEHQSKQLHNTSGTTDGLTVMPQETKWVRR